MYMARNFNIDLARIASALPFSMRSASVLGMLRAGFAPYTHHLAAKFHDARAGDHFRLRHNGQVCYLRAALNARFRSSLKGVFFQIGDTGVEKAWIYAKVESFSPTAHTYALTEPEPIPLPPNPKNRNAPKEKYPDFNPPYAPSEVKPGEQHSFIVYVPSDLYYSNLTQIKGFVDEYRLVGRKVYYEPINS